MIFDNPIGTAYQNNGGFVLNHRFKLALHKLRVWLFEILNEVHAYFVV